MPRYADPGGVAAIVSFALAATPLGSRLRVGDFRGCRYAQPHRHQLNSNSKSAMSLSNSIVPGFERLLRRHVLVKTLRRSNSTRCSSSGLPRLAARRLTKSRIARHTFVQLFDGSPHTQPSISQCCTMLAMSLAHMRIIWRTSVEPLKTAIRLRDFQRLNNNSTCQRARYSTAASCGVSLSRGTFVTRIVQSHQANRSSLGSRPLRLQSSRNFRRRQFAWACGKRQAIRRQRSFFSLPRKIEQSTNPEACFVNQAIRFAAPPKLMADSTPVAASISRNSTSVPNCSRDRKYSPAASCAANTSRLKYPRSRICNEPGPYNSCCLGVAPSGVRPVSTSNVTRPLRSSNSVCNFNAALPAPYEPPQPANSSAMLSGNRIVEPSLIDTVVKRSRIGANVWSEPTTIRALCCTTSCKNLASRGVWRRSMACGVTSTPHCAAIWANSSSEAFGDFKKPMTNVCNKDVAENFRWRRMTPLFSAACMQTLSNNCWIAAPTLAIISTGSSFFQIQFVAKPKLWKDFPHFVNSRCTKLMRMGVERSDTP